VETIYSGSGVPRELVIPTTQLNLLEDLKETFNTFHMGIIPYCMTCKVPLRWHFEDPSKVLFSCDNCGRVWKEKKE